MVSSLSQVYRIPYKVVYLRPTVMLLAADGNATLGRRLMTKLGPQKNKNPTRFEAGGIFCLLGCLEKWGLGHPFVCLYSRSSFAEVSRQGAAGQRKSRAKR